MKPVELLLSELNAAWQRAIHISYCKDQQTTVIYTKICSATDEDDEQGLAVAVDPNLRFENPSLRQAYIALQAWKSAIYSDPLNFTANWVGSKVCSYKGVYCAQSPTNDSHRVVAGIDLNHADIAGYLPPELASSQI
ncbi:leucine-rich repeat extensin-like protein 2 [Quercus suber]|uniref:Leucine-rich repeat extensin-like protein 2 n=1 Tax=Quercus suber TaxID=58331 RepID=A0AAW0JZM8_QUESU